MLFDWSSYLIVARNLLEGSTEAEWRSAISRAYYAAFNQAKRLASGVRTSEGSHDKVWNEIERSGDRKRVAVGKHGQRLKHARVRADYERQVQVSKQDAEAALRVAETLLRHLQELQQAPI